MSRLSENLLYLLVKSLYRTEIGHTAEMKEALTDIDKFDAYRSAQIDFIGRNARAYGVELEGKAVLDLGCGDGAITPKFLDKGAEHVIGVDIDEKAIGRARTKYATARVSYYVSEVDYVPLPDDSVDTIVCYDVFEHVARPAVLLEDCRRVLRVGGEMLIGTWGWYHPFAPHLWSTLPVPWAHVFFSERTILRTCRRVYHSPWYVPNMVDLDEKGQRLPDKYVADEISVEYLNKYLLRDFARVFRSSSFDYVVHSVPFGSRYARWTKVFLKVPWVREFITGYIWVVLRKKSDVRQALLTPLLNGAAGKSTGTASRL